MNKFARRALTATLAAAMIPALAPSASAVDIHSQITGIQNQISTEVSNVQEQAHDTLLSHIGEGITVDYGYTTISSQQGSISAPVATDQNIVNQVNQVVNDYGVTVETGYDTAAIAPVSPGTQRVYDASLEPGAETVVSEGKSGISWNVGATGGQITPATDKVVAFGPEKPKPAPAPQPAVTTGDYGVWTALAQCESGGNWSINTGNGYYGGLQFHPQTWTGHGGGQYAPYAHQATPEQQIEVAKRVQASQGWGAWPACTSKLGIR